MSMNTYSRRILIVFCCVISGFCTTSVFAQTAEELHESAMSDYNQTSYGAAMSNFRKAADMGYAPSQAKLATLLDASEFDEEARAWFKKAADQGDLEGLTGLARMLALGEGGEKDQATAVKLYTKAAESGSMAAMLTLQSAFSKGDLGLAVNPERADYWQKRAAAESGQ